MPSSGGLPVPGNAPSGDVYTARNQMGGVSYDAAGNQTAVNGNAVAYDAENRQAQVTEPQSLGAGAAQYIYDGAGQRVTKIMGGVTTVYVYDVFGTMAAQYSTNPAETELCQTCYLSVDHLGTTRLVTDPNANVIARHDYTPFGQEIQAGWAARGQQWAIGDGVTEKFTGQDRDSETGIDYFHARYYGSAFGRFTSPDPANAGADLTNPQSWNGYSYVLGNPLVYTDPSGLCASTDNPPCYSGGTTLNTGSPDFATTDNPYQASDWISFLNYALERLTLDGGGGAGAGGSGQNKSAAPTPQVVPLPPKTGNPPLAACESAILNAINTKFKTDFTSTNVKQRFQFSKGAPDGQGTLNLNMAVPAAMQPTKVAIGRYPVNPATYVLGAGATLHIPPGPGGADSPLTLPFKADQFTAHLDSALPYSPIGLFTHLLQDMSSLGGYKPCP